MTSTFRYLNSAEMIAMNTPPPTWAMTEAREVYAKGHDHDSPILAQDIRDGKLDFRELLIDIACALVAERERAAKYHDDQIAELQAQIERNNKQRLRSGHQDASANDYCRQLIDNHRLSAAAIRKGD